MLESRMVSNHTSHVVHVGNLSPVSMRMKYSPTPEISLDNQGQIDPAVILGGLILPPIRQTWSSGERFRPSGYTATSAYWTHKQQHAISTFNTYSRGPTHRSLTDTDRSYNLGAVGLPQSTPRPSQLMVSTFHLRVLLDLQFNQVPPFKPKF
jgi:hypothetical protein